MVKEERREDNREDGLIGERGDLKDLINVLICFETHFCRRMTSTLTNFK